MKEQSQRAIISPEPVEAVSQTIVVPIGEHIDFELRGLHFPYLVEQPYWEVREYEPYLHTSGSTVYQTFVYTGKDASQIETTLERQERRIEMFQSEIARRDAIIASLKSKCKTLERLQANSVTHKRLARYSLMFFVLFAFSLLVRVFTDTMVVEPFWNVVGLLLSSAFYLMSVLMGNDWRRLVSGK